MTTVMKPITVAALCPISEKAQHIVADIGDIETVRALAASPHLCGSVASRLAHSSDVTTSVRALPKSDDVAHAARLVSHGGVKAPHAAQNPKLSPLLLEDSARRAADPVALRALLNPSLKEDVRRSVLTPQRAQELVDVALTAGGDVIRGYELVLANQWMLETPTDWSLSIRRGLTTLAQMTSEQYEAIRKAGYSSWDSFRSHPCRTGTNTEVLSTADLVTIGSSATDMAAIARPDLTLDDAVRMCAQGRRLPEPHVVARVVAIFGPTAFSQETQRHPRYGFSATAHRAAAWACPAVAYASETPLSLYNECARSVRTLGDDRTAWEMFSLLSTSMVGDLADLAQASSVLAS